MVKNPPASAGDVGSIPGSGRSLGEGNGTHSPVFLPGKSNGQRSLVDCRWTVHGIAKSQTQFSNETTTKYNKVHSYPSGNAKGFQDALPVAGDNNYVFLFYLL